jgi:hypothetical protein
LYRDFEWGHSSPTLTSDRTSFTGPWPDPTQRFRRNRPSARHFFDLFWDDSTVNDLVRETNRYARQQCTMENDPRRRGRPAGSNGGPKWTPTDRVEMRAFLGVVILMGLKTSPTIRDYWKQDSFWRCGLIPRIFTRDRFESLLRCLHCVDNSQQCTDTTSPLYDKIRKVRPVMDPFVKRSQELYNPEKFLTADEVMIAYRGHFSPIRQYIPAKPTRYGIKVWALVSNPSRYDFEAQKRHLPLCLRFFSCLLASPLILLPHV